MLQKRRDVFPLETDVEIGHVIIQRFPLDGDIAIERKALDYYVADLDIRLKRENIAALLKQIDISDPPQKYFDDTYLTRAVGSR